jgi:hypothetical protein
MVKLDKKKIIILSSALCVVLVGILLFVFLGNKSDDNESISSNIDRTKLLNGYANDTEKAIKKGEFQSFEKSDITFNVYGEVGYNDFAATTLDPVEMDTACSDDELQNIELGNVNNKISLGSEKITLKNHCVIQLYWSSDVSYIISDDYAYSLSAYIELPDGTLIAINSTGSPRFQVNIYDNETRIVLEKGTAYFRILKQAANKIFTVQVGDKIFQPTEASEFFAYSQLIPTYGYDKTYITNQLAFLKDVNGSEQFISNINNKSGVTFNVASFQLIKGNGDIYTRGTNDKTSLTEKEYRFAYKYANYRQTSEKDGGKMGDDTYYVDANNLSLTSVGSYITEADELDTHKDFYQFLENQKALNKLNYGFDNIIVKKANISEIMKKYLAEFTSIAKQKLIAYNANKPKDDSTCSYSWFLSMLDNCGCQDGWYHIAHVGCCPNGYTYSSSDNKCVKTTIVSSCPSGTYQVSGNKCCPNGTTLSSNGLSCVYPSTGTKSIPSYYPNSNGGATKDSPSKVTTDNSDNSCKPTVVCETKEESCLSYGMYEKDGKCCMNLVCVE